MSFSTVKKRVGHHAYILIQPAPDGRFNISYDALPSYKHGRVDFCNLQLCHKFVSRNATNNNHQPSEPQSKVALSFEKTYELPA
jgi:hypothetical protein